MSWSRLYPALHRALADGDFDAFPKPATMGSSLRAQAGVLFTTRLLACSDSNMLVAAYLVGI